MELKLAFLVLTISFKKVNPQNFLSFCDNAIHLAHIFHIFENIVNNPMTSATSAFTALKFSVYFDVK